MIGLDASFPFCIALDNATIKPDSRIIEEGVQHANNDYYKTNDGKVRWFIAGVIDGL
jgi:hypothetical protein